MKTVRGPQYDYCKKCQEFREEVIERVCLECSVTSAVKDIKARLLIVNGDRPDAR